MIVVVQSPGALTRPTGVRPRETRYRRAEGLGPPRELSWRQKQCARRLARGRTMSGPTPPEGSIGPLEPPSNGLDRPESQHEGSLLPAIPALPLICIRWGLKGSVAFNVLKPRFVPVLGEVWSAIRVHFASRYGWRGDCGAVFPGSALRPFSHVIHSGQPTSYRKMMIFTTYRSSRSSVTVSAYPCCRFSVDEHAERRNTSIGPPFQRGYL